MSTSLLGHPCPSLQPFVGYPAPSRAQSATTHVYSQGLRRLNRTEAPFSRKTGVCSSSFTLRCSQGKLTAAHDVFTHRKQFLLASDGLLGQVVLGILILHHNLFSSLTFSVLYRVFLTLHVKINIVQTGYIHLY